MEQEQEKIFKEGDTKGQYIIQKFLGEGTQGQVYLAFDTKDNNKEVAIKCIPLKNIENTIFSQYFARELLILKENESENCISLIKKLKDKNYFYIITEYCNNGDLNDYLSTFPNKRMNECKAIELFKGILNGVKSIHMKNIIHRDLKLQNIFIHNGEPRIGDFGGTKKLQFLDSITHTLVGTPIVMAPEVLLGKSYTIKCDVYSLGVIFYSVLFGQSIYGQRTDLVKCICDNIEIDYNFNGVKISENMKILIQSMLEHDQNKRISMQQVWENPIFQEESEMVTHCKLRNKGINIQNQISDYNRVGNVQQIEDDNKKLLDQVFLEFSEIDIENITLDARLLLKQQEQKKKQEEELNQDIDKFYKEINIINRSEKCYYSMRKYNDKSLVQYYVSKKGYYLLKEFEQKLNNFEKNYPNQELIQENEQFQTLKVEVINNKNSIKQELDEQDDEGTDSNSKEVYDNQSEEKLKLNIIEFYLKSKDKIFKYEDQIKKTNDQQFKNEFKRLITLINRSILYMADTIMASKYQENINDYIPDYENLSHEELIVKAHERMDNVINSQNK